MRIGLFLLFAGIVMASLLSVQGAAASAPCTGTGSGSGNILCLNVMVSNAIIDVGQYSFITVNDIYSGISPYTANFVFSTANAMVPPSNTQTFAFGLSPVVNGIITIGANAPSANQMFLASYNGLSLAPVGTNLIVANSPTTLNLFGAWTFNAVIADSVGNVLETNSIPFITLNPQLNSPAQTLSTIGSTNGNVIDQDQSLTLKTTPSGGSSPYTCNILISNTLASSNVVRYATTLPSAGPCSAAFSNLPLGLLNANIIVNDSASTNSVVASPYNVLSVYPKLNVHTVQFAPPFPFITVGTNAVIGLDPNTGGAPSVHYEWHNGSVAGGYDQLQFSLLPPFQMPSPPTPGTPPRPMFYYQNPASTNAITPYVFNGVAFNAIPPANSLAVLAGNEIRLPVFIPNIFTVTSNLSTAFTINALALAPNTANSLAPASNPTNKLIYSLDSYSLLQSNTLNAASIYASNAPQVKNALASRLVGVNVILTNLGISGNYVTQNVPFGIAIIGITPVQSNLGAVQQSVVFVTFNSLPAKNGEISVTANTMMDLQNMGQTSNNPLFDNISFVALMAPPLPAPGISISIFDSANVETPTTDTANNLLLASYTYNGPLLLYNVTGENYLGEIPAIGNAVASYSGEYGATVPLTLTANAAVATTTPANSVTYFTYNVPELTAGSAQANSFVYLNLTNASQLTTFPAYSFSDVSNAMNQNLFYVLPPGYQGPVRSGRMDPSGITLRGSVVGPVSPVGLSYYMATNVITFNAVSASTTNSITFTAHAANLGPNVFNFNGIDSASSPEQFNGLIAAFSLPEIQAANIMISNSILHVGETTYITITLQGGQPPYTGKWNIVPPSAASTTANTFILTLPFNTITLLANVTSSNTIIFTPTIGANSTVAGGRNNSMLLSIYDNNADLILPSFGGIPGQSLLLATGLASNSVFGLWDANAIVSGSDPSRGFVVVTALSAGAPTPANPTVPYGGTTTLYANPSGGQTPYTYQWYSGSSSSCTSDSAISGATSNTYVAGSSGYYCYGVTDSESVKVTDYSSATDVTVQGPIIQTGGAVNQTPPPQTTTTTTIPTAILTVKNVTVNVTMTNPATNTPVSVSVSGVQMTNIRAGMSENFTLAGGKNVNLTIISVSSGNVVARINGNTSTIAVGVPFRFDPAGYTYYALLDSTASGKYATLLAYAEPNTIPLTTTTTTAITTIPSTTTITSPAPIVPQQKPSNNGMIEAIAAVLIIAIALAYMLSKKKRNKNRR